MPRKRLGALSPGESLLIARRRSGLNQQDMAGIFGVSVATLKRWESDERDVPKVRLRHIEAREWCFILRRREGMLHHDVAAALGLKAKWVHRAERGESGNLSPLVLFWETKLGITLPATTSAKAGVA